MPSAPNTQADSFQVIKEDPRVEAMQQGSESSVCSKQTNRQITSNQCTTNRMMILAPVVVDIHSQGTEKVEHQSSAHSAPHMITRQLGSKLDEVAWSAPRFEIRD